ncbi:MAG: glycine cleavage T C-terminal barrel domain-containing protein [Phycisphaerales bacterium]|nr:glycine cleavage T C-terminal barrel domain-containing protein [Phycisphaerales bacterium]
MRPAGWFACNIARIEAGTPLFPIDFGPENLPHESGVLDDRVSFRKGCYLGQEVVARMQSLGHPKQRLIALRLVGDNACDEHANTRQPVGGAHVFARSDAGGNPVGTITSSTISPMLAGEVACFAMMRYANSDPGAELTIAADGAYVDAMVQPSLRFWSREPALKA